MRWEDFRRSDNIEDVRGEGGFGGGGGGFPIPGGGGGIGIGTIIILGLIGWFLGIDPRILIGGAEIFQGPGQTQTRQAPPAKRGAPSDRQGDFVAAVIGSTEDVWSDIFRANGQTYRPARLRDLRWHLRHGAVRDGTVLLPAGPAHLP
jgi:predicted metalloprotease